ncbi:MAG: asparagine--tRNA ligase [Oscillospiraceae bacterium]|nr:asparagine--tRNA ligase [Oscillospiraceae bacterium]
MPKLLIDEIYKSVKGLLPNDNAADGATVTVEGWMRTNRSNNNIGFISLNDGSCFTNCQVVYEAEKLPNYAEISKLLTGCAVSVTGKLIHTPEAKQPFEINASEIALLGACDASYPLQKKRHSLEFLREIPHLRPRTNTFMAVFKIRSIVSQSIHQFFRENGFSYIHTPLITGNDAEGAGETFTVTTREDGDYQNDFFGKHACLTVSGQLHVEPFALALGKVYTFGPTFRAENSNTPYHLNEFWMVEPEMAFCDLKGDMAVMEALVKYIIKDVLESCPDEMKFLNDFVSEKHDLIDKLEHVMNSDFKVITYTEAVDYLQHADVQFENPVEWGMDFFKEHEVYICDKVAKGPVFLIDFPKDIKAFYMKLNPDGKTVAACDLLAPGVGELMGGSQREENFDVLVKKMEDMNMDRSTLEWYLDLRKYGGVVHSGFGLGLERILMYITGVSNIRDVIPYARTPKSLKF